jgi:hypothetical protein
MGKLLISHRSTIYPCFIPDLGEFDRSWSYKTYPLQKYKIYQMPDKKLFNFLYCSIFVHLHNTKTLNSDIMEKKYALLSESAKAGLVIGAVGIVVFLIEYVAGIMPVGIVTPILMLLVGLAISITILVIYLKKYRSSLGGFISFKDAFLFGLIALIVSVVLSSLFSLIFMQFFDPGYTKSIMEAQKNWMENYLAGKMSDDQIQEQLDKIDLQMTKSAIKQTLTTLAGGAVFSLIISLIVGAIMKKNPNVFEDSATGGVI